MARQPEPVRAQPGLECIEDCEDKGLGGAGEGKHSGGYVQTKKRDTPYTQAAGGVR